MSSIENILLVLGVVLFALMGQSMAEIPRFEAYQIGDVGNSMGQTSLVDVDRDGDLDWVVGQAGKMWWFEYVAADKWIQHDMGRGAKTDVGGCACCCGVIRSTPPVSRKAVRWGAVKGSKSLRRWPTRDTATSPGTGGFLPTNRWSISSGLWSPGTSGHALQESEPTNDRLGEKRRPRCNRFDKILVRAHGPAVPSNLAGPRLLGEPLRIRFHAALSSQLPSGLSTVDCWHFATRTSTTRSPVRVVVGVLAGSPVPPWPAIGTGGLG